jgi:hypothetical protein
MLSMLLLGAGCGENVLVGNLQLRSLSDAGADIAEAVEADGGINPQGPNAEGARAKAERKANGDKDNGNDHAQDKGHN